MFYATVFVCWMALGCAFVNSDRDNALLTEEICENKVIEIEEFLIERYGMPTKIEKGCVDREGLLELYKKYGIEDKIDDEGI